MKNILFTMVLLQGCVTANPNKVVTIDTSIQAKGQVGNQTVGLNNNQEIIMQEEQNAADELRVQQAVNYKFQEELSQEAFMLQKCRTDVADPRLGGSGVLPPEFQTDGIKIAEDIKESVGLNDDGELKVVRKTYFIDKLKIERLFEKSLVKMTRTLSRQRAECEYAMGIARRNAGLSSTRYQGQGYYSGGVFIQTHQNENSLDDAFAIKARETVNTADINE